MAADVRESVSVALATYNGERFLEAQLDSLAAQTLLPAELVVGDDGSSDGTIRILEGFAARAPFPVSIVRNAKSLGCGDNFIAIARRCRSEWVAFCDQDDVWFPQKLQRCLDLAEEAGNDTMLVMHDAMVTTEDLKPVGTLGRKPFGLFPRFGTRYDVLPHGFRQVFRRRLLDGLPDEGRRMGWLPGPEAHDNFTMVIAGLSGTVVISDEVLAFYRRHATTLTGIVVPTMQERAQQITGRHAREYRSTADALQAFADYLAASAAGEGRNPATDSAAQERVRGLATALEMRAAMYHEPSRLWRLRHLKRMISEGRYSVRDPWRLGVKSLLKDLLFVVAR